jgi:hypothetical protein
MLKSLQVRFYQIIEIWKTKGMASLFHEVIYINRELILVEKNLVEFQPKPISEGKTGFKLIEISEQIAKDRRLKFSNKIRFLKINKNLSKGYNGFALIKNDEMIGDIWFIKPDQTGALPYHPDLKLLEIKIGPGQAYMFDAFIEQDERGGGNINLFLNKALLALKNSGFKKIYGYYMADNLPALWMHRLFGYKEINRIKLPWHFKLSQIRY